MAASPEYDLADLDEDDEPLFADDVDDDDPPPLPPPMPTFSQLSQTANSGAAAALRVNSNSAENFGGMFLRKHLAGIAHALLYM